MPEVLTLVFLLPCLAIDVLAQQKAGDLKLTPRVFESARGQKVDVEFGELTVPENRRKADSRLIQIAFIRFKSTSKTPAAPIVYLAGGPGGSGIAAARGTRFPLFMVMREIADVIRLSGAIPVTIDYGNRLLTVTEPDAVVQTNGEVFPLTFNWLESRG